MMKNSDQKIFLLLFLFMLSSSAFFSQQDFSNLKSRLDSLLADNFFSKTQIAIDVFDLTKGSSVYSKNEKILLRPASVQKILTTSTALKFIDPDYNFKTTLYHTGEVEDSVCTGDVFIVGGFDPDFSQQDLETMVNGIREYGINEIKGNLYADVSAGDSLFWGEGWMWDDDPGAFAAYLSPLNINDNSVKIICEPAETGKPVNVKMFPQNNFLEIKNNSTTIDSGKSTLNITRDWLNRRNTIFISGNMPANVLKDSSSVNIFNPTYYFLKLIKESFERQKIKFDGKPDTLTLHNDAEEIFCTERNIDSVIVNTNKTSDNLSAEMILRAISFRNLSKPATAGKGIYFVDSLISLAGFDPRNYRIVDGSGLSFYNLISAELVTGILKYLYQNEEDLFIKLYNSFPISGYDGTLEKRMDNSPAQKRVRAKTGTLSGASNLAGYMHSKTGNILAFTIFVQNYKGSASQARFFQDKICELLFEEL